MASVIYRVRAPDGSTLKIEGPEGATNAEVEAAAAKLYAQNEATPVSQSKVNAPLVNTGALADTLKDAPRYVGNAVKSFATGAGDLAVGAGQLMTHVLPDSVLRPLARGADYLAGGTGEVSGDLTQRYNQAMQQREQAYQASRENPDLPDVGRFTGNVVTSGILGAGAPAATLPGRMLQGARIGGAIGLVSPVDPEAQSYVIPKALQVTGGAILGGLAPAVVEGAIRGVGSAANAIARSVKGMAKSVTGATRPENIANTLSAEMERNGVKWSELPREVREGLIAEVRKAVKSGGTLDDAATGRLADFLKLKMQPTQGQLTRDPLQYAREVNYSKTGIGKPLSDRFTEQNRQLIGTVDTLRANIGAQGADQYAAGQNVVNALRATDAAKKAAVDKAYNVARANAGIEADVPMQPIAQRLGQVVEDYGEDRIPGAVTKRLNEFGLMGGKQTRAFTIREAEKLKTLIGNNIDAPGTPTAKALTLLKTSVDDAVNSIGDQEGSQAAGAFREARGLAAQRFQALRRTPGLEKAISSDPGAPEKFIESQVVRGDVQDVANLMMRLKPQARGEVRAAVLDWIKGKGVSGVEDTGQFSQAGYNRALKTLGERKLGLIFAGDKEALSKLEALGRVGAYIQRPPVSSGVNYSNTATTGLDFLDQLFRLPVLKQVIGSPSDMVRAAQAANAMRAIAPVQAATPTIPPALLDRSALLGGALSAPTAAVSVPYVMKKARR